MGWIIAGLAFAVVMACAFALRRFGEALDLYEDRVVKRRW